MHSLPPKPVLALRVGITGHRLHRKAADGTEQSAGVEEAQVRTAIDQVLTAIERTLGELKSRYGEWFAPAPPTVALVSSLAEGADRIAAQSALAKNIPLEVVLPFSRTRYETTFTDDGSRQEFARLLGAARATLVLPAPRGAAADEESLGAAYENGGLSVLAQSDLLIAVWDGEAARGRGGTAEIVDEAARQDTPIVIIDPRSGEPRLRWQGARPLPVSVRHVGELADATIETGLATLIERLVEPPMLAHETDGMRMFFNSPIEGGVQHFGWKALRWTLGLDRGKTPPPPRHAAASQPDVASESNRAAEAHLKAAIDAAGKVAEDKAHAFRSAFVVNFFLGAMAVFFVASSIILKALPLEDKAVRWWHGWLVMGELTCVATVVIYLLDASRRQWHRRWFEAREVAERLRVAQPFWRLGIWPHNPAAYQPAWTGWYTRGILRDQPVFSGDLGTSLPAAKAVLWDVIDGQIDYHRRTIADLEHLDRYLTIMGISCLAVTVVGASIFFIGGVFMYEWEMPRHAEAVITALAVFLPALATAAYGIRLLGDFEDTVRRSRHTLQSLEPLSRSLEGSIEDLAELRTCARLAADAMLADVESWRVAVESRNLSAA
jgi:hypothetical protein